MLSLFGQGDTYFISREFQTRPFIYLIEDVEKHSSITFYYQPVWLDSLIITHTTKNVSLEKVLKDNLSKAGLTFYSIHNNYYLFKGSEIVLELPDFIQNNLQENGNGNESEILTETEKKYIEGRKAVSAEVITVGEKQKAVNGEVCIVSGKIVDKTTGEPLFGATVYVESLKMGTATDVDGRFKLALKSGKYRTYINFISMKQKEIFLQVYSSGSTTIEMTKELIEITEVTVSANRYDNVAGMQMGYEKISSKAMKEIPVVMGEKDILKVAQMLPGVLNVGEGSVGFNVRGSAADQNMFYINRVPVYNTAHLFGFFTSFSPDIISDFSLYKSNIPARYGGRLASIFEISTRQGNKKNLYGHGGISPVTAHFSFEGPIQKDKTSFVTSWRSSYSDWILKRIKDPDLKESSAFFYDASLALNSELNNKNLVKIFGYRSYDEFTLSSKNDYSYENLGASAIWKHLFSSSLTGDFSLVFGQNKFTNTDKNNISEAYTHSYRMDHYETKADFNYISPSNHRIEFGANAIVYDLSRGDLVPFGEESNRMATFLGREKSLEGALYISDEFKIFSRLSLLAGLRYSIYGLLGPQEIFKYYTGSPVLEENIRDTSFYNKNKVVKHYSGPEYRIALNYQFATNSSVKLSYNRLRQYVFMLSNTIAISPTDQWKLCDYHIVPPVSDQISMGYYQDFAKKTIKASMEVYYKWVNHVVEYRDGADFVSDDPMEWQILQGDQTTYGIEFMLKKNSGKFTGWLSYTYSRSIIQVNSALEENKINNGISYPSNHDRPHSLNYVSNLRLNRRLSFSTNVIYATGRPVTYPIAVYQSEGRRLIHYSSRNEYRIPDYFRVDLSVNVEGNLKNKKLAHSYWMLNIYNLLGRKNAYSVYFTVDEDKIQGYKLSIFAQPIVTLSWNFKFGNYLSN